MNTYHLHQITINNVAVACDSLTPDERTQSFMEAAGASSIATVGGTKVEEPMIKGVTRDCKTFLDAVPLVGLALTGSGNSKAILYMAKLADGFGFASGSVHKKRTVTKGLVVIDSIEAGADGEPARISFSIYAVWDGTNAPFVDEDSQALPSTPARLSNLWVCGPAGGVETQGWTLNLGPQVKVRRIDGEIWPRQVGIEKYDIKLNGRTLDAGIAASKGLVEDFVAYLRKHDANTEARVADATEEHISFTIATGFLYCGQSSLGWPGEATFEFNVDCIHNGTDATVVMDTTAAIV